MSIFPSVYGEGEDRTNSRSLVMATVGPIGPSLSSSPRLCTEGRGGVDGIRGLFPVSRYKEVRKRRGLESEVIGINRRSKNVSGHTKE